jgi:hypothetical protein
MPRCIGRNVSDTIDKGKIAFFHEDSLQPKRYYHIAIQCDRTSVKDKKLCKECIEKEKLTNSLSSKKNRINVDHPSVLHGTMNDPIPIWSHIEGGEWFKKMLAKGYSVEEMGKKNFPDEKDVFLFIASLKDTKKETIIETLMKKYTVFSKTSANKYLIAYKKNKKEPLKEKEKKTKTIKQKEVVNSIVIDESKTFVVNDSLTDEYRIVEVKLVPLNDFYRHPETNNVYNKEFKYIGRYNESDKSIEEVDELDYED